MWTLSTPMRLDTFWIHISGLMPFRLLLLLDFLCYAHSNVRTSATYKSKQQQQQKQQKQQQHSPRKSRFSSIACTHEEIVRNDRSGARAALHASQRIARSTLQAVAMHMHMMCRVELSLLPTRTKRNLPCSDWQMQLYCHRSFKYSSLIWDHFSLLENAIQVPPRDRGFLLPRKSRPPTFLHCLLPRVVARVRAANYRCLCCSHPRTAPSVWKGEKLVSQQAPVFACEAYEHAAILFLLFFSRFLSGMFSTNQSHSALTIQHSSADDLLLYFVSPLEFLSVHLQRIKEICTWIRFQDADFQAWRLLELVTELTEFLSFHLCPIKGIKTLYMKMRSRMHIFQLVKFLIVQNFSFHQSQGNCKNQGEMLISQWL